ncbi:hypothetical protein P167DRAFT_579053 [Morchella conica CCBAS932]|uniref:Major facilitator superfamily (MFS) profile domain-containing protein n=1 Tax=Morchella conica CCBAS932 TaxID=1392247 RepID=A0A3N4KEE5_9PEZI|nr:hypothetical protein P167DRAFT_579053 [Morchella conica CCBAS932]
MALVFYYISLDPVKPPLSLMILMGIWSFFCVPETKGLTLEDMDRLFGVPERIESEGMKRTGELEKGSDELIDSVDNANMRR